MIVSHSHKLVYLAVPRTGTSSVYKDYVPHMGEGWYHDVTNQGCPWEISDSIKSRHISYKDVKEHIDKLHQEGYRCITTIRDPLSRLASMCSYYHRNIKIDVETMCVNLKKRLIEQSKLNTQNSLFTPQHDYIYDEGGYTPFELYHYDSGMLYEILRKHVPDINQSRANRGRRNQMEIYKIHPSLEEMCHDIYHKDFGLFE